MGLTYIESGDDSKKNVHDRDTLNTMVQLQTPFRRQTIDSTCEISICGHKRRSGDTQSTAHANMRTHKSTSNPDVNTHRPIGSAILRRHELRRERGLRVAQGYWPSTVRREHRRAMSRSTAMTPTNCEASIAIFHLVND